MLESYSTVRKERTFPEDSYLPWEGDGTYWDDRQGERSSDLQVVDLDEELQMAADLPAITKVTRKSGPLWEGSG
jgi:hypothetical protein